MSFLSSFLLSELGQPGFPHARRRWLVHAPHLLLLLPLVCWRPCTDGRPGSVVAEVVHALARSPRRHVYPGAKGPLGFALAVVSAVEEPASDGEGGEADDENYEHDDPAPVGRHPRGGAC